MRKFIILSFLLGFGHSQLQSAPGPADWFLLTSFVDEKEGLHLAVSSDGLKWEAVNGDRSVLKPAIPEVFRDPSIARDESGTYHLVWTIAWGCGQHKGIGHASSKDLIRWSDQHVIPVMENRKQIVPLGGYRHGTVIRITADHAKRLLQHDYRTMSAPSGPG